MKTLRWKPVLDLPRQRRRKSKPNRTKKKGSASTKSEYMFDKQQGTWTQELDQMTLLP